MKKETKKQLLIGAALVLELLLLLLYLNGRIDKLLDSDMSSEMVLGQLLAQNNELMTTKFYYSTEMRVLEHSARFCIVLQTVQGLACYKNGRNGLPVGDLDRGILLSMPCDGMQKIFSAHSTPAVCTCFKLLL